MARSNIETRGPDQHRIRTYVRNGVVYRIAHKMVASNEQRATFIRRCQIC